MKAASQKVGTVIAVIATIVVAAATMQAIAPGPTGPFRCSTCARRCVRRLRGGAALAAPRRRSR